MVTSHVGNTPLPLKFDIDNRHPKLPCLKGDYFFRKKPSFVCIYLKFRGCKTDFDEIWNKFKVSTGETSIKRSGAKCQGNFPTKIGCFYIPETEVTSFWAMNGIIWCFPSSFPFACFFVKSSSWNGDYLSFICIFSGFRVESGWCLKMNFRRCCLGYFLGLPSRQDASHHQDYYVFSRELL